MDTSLFPRTCEACGSADLARAFSVRDRNRNVDQREFLIVRCNQCGTGCTIPRLSGKELTRYYPVEYYSLHNNLALEKATRPHNQIRIERIRRHVQSGRLLDIGAGTGMFLRTAREYGFDVEGLEISPEAAAFARDTWNLSMHRGDLYEVVFPPETYDVVTLGHVFEHLPDPHRAAKKLFMILKHGGLLVVAVPNFASLQARLFRSSWFHLDVPRHLFHYTPESVKTVLERAGFSIDKINLFSGEHNWAGILGSIMALNKPGESLLHKSVRKLLGRPLARVLALLESAAGRGGTFEIYATKP